MKRQQTVKEKEKIGFLFGNKIKMIFGEAAAGLLFNALSHSLMVLEFVIFFLKKSLMIHSNGMGVVSLIHWNTDVWFLGTCHHLIRRHELLNGRVFHRSFSDANKTFKKRIRDYFTMKFIL